MKQKFCADILSTSCWQDFDDETKPPYFGWQIEHLWINEDGKYTTCDCDGNHEYFDGRGIRAFYRDAEQSWKDYAKWVAENKCDPLGNYFVKPTHTIKQRWTAVASSWVGASKNGLAVRKFKRGNRIVNPDIAPKEVKDYFQLKKVCGVWCMDGIPDFKTINRKPGPITALVEFKIPNKNYEQELVAAATKKTP